MSQEKFYINDFRHHHWTMRIEVRLIKLSQLFKNGSLEFLAESRPVQNKNFIILYKFYFYKKVLNQLQGQIPRTGKTKFLPYSCNWEFNKQKFSWSKELGPDKCENLRPRSKSDLSKCRTDAVSPDFCSSLCSKSDKKNSTRI